MLIQVAIATYAISNCYVQVANAAYAINNFYVQLAIATYAISNCYVQVANVTSTSKLVKILLLRHVATHINYTGQGRIHST